MEPHLIGLFIDLSSANKIWDSVTQTFYDGADESQFYELRCKAMRTKQCGRPVSLYYAELDSVWQEIDKRRPIKLICAADLRTRQEEIQKDWIYDFLAGLDEVFDSVRSDLLWKKSVPSIEGFSWRNLRKWFPACASIQFDGRLSDKSPCWEQKTLVKDHR